MKKTLTEEINRIHQVMNFVTNKKDGIPSLIIKEDKGEALEKFFKSFVDDIENYISKSVTKSDGTVEKIIDKDIKNNADRIFDMEKIREYGIPQGTNFENEMKAYVDALNRNKDWEAMRKLIKNTSEVSESFSNIFSKNEDFQNYVEAYEKLRLKYPKMQSLENVFGTKLINDVEKSITKSKTSSKIYTSLKPLEIAKFQDWLFNKGLINEDEFTRGEWSEKMKYLYSQYGKSFEDFLKKPIEIKTEEDIKKFQKWMNDMEIPWVEKENPDGSFTKEYIDTSANSKNGFGIWGPNTASNYQKFKESYKKHLSLEQRVMYESDKVYGLNELTEKEMNIFKKFLFSRKTFLNVIRPGLYSVFARFAKTIEEQNKIIEQVAIKFDKVANIIKQSSGKSVDSITEEIGTATREIKLLMSKLDKKVDEKKIEDAFFTALEEKGYGKDELDTLREVMKKTQPFFGESWIKSAVKGTSFYNVFIKQDEGEKRIKKVLKGILNFEVFTGSFWTKSTVESVYSAKYGSNYLRMLIFDLYKVKFLFIPIFTSLIEPIFYYMYLYFQPGDVKGEGGYIASVIKHLFGAYTTILKNILFNYGENIFTIEGWGLWIYSLLPVHSFLYDQATLFSDWSKRVSEGRERMQKDATNQINQLITTELDKLRREHPGMEITFKDTTINGVHIPNFPVIKGVTDSEPTTSNQSLTPEQATDDFNMVLPCFEECNIKLSGGENGVFKADLDKVKCSDVAGIEYVKKFDDGKYWTVNSNGDKLKSKSIGC